MQVGKVRLWRAADKAAGHFRGFADLCINTLDILRGKCLVEPFKINLEGSEGK